MDGVGLTARRKTIGMPLEMPPKMPPQWLVVGDDLAVFQRGTRRYFRCPRRPAAAKPRPNVNALDGRNGENELR